LRFLKLVGNVIKKPALQSAGLSCKNLNDGTRKRTNLDLGGYNSGRARLVPIWAPKEISRQQQANNLLMAIREALHELYDAGYYGAEVRGLFPLGVDDLPGGKSSMPRDAAKPRRLLVAKRSAQSLDQDWTLNAVRSSPMHFPAISSRA